MSPKCSRSRWRRSGAAAGAPGRQRLGPARLGLARPGPVAPPAAPAGTQRRPQPPVPRAEGPPAPGFLRFCSLTFYVGLYLKRDTYFFSFSFFFLSDPGFRSPGTRAALRAASRRCRRRWERTPAPPRAPLAAGSEERNDPGAARCRGYLLISA